MTKISNPYQKIKGYNCFGCSPTNNSGLKLEFFEDNEGVYSKWIPSNDFQGWMGVLHGGIQATLLDEIANWLILVKLERTGVTSELKIRYKKSVKMTDKPLLIKGVFREMQRNIAVVDAYIYDHEEKLCTQAECKFFLFSDDVGKKDYYYPGKDAFYI